MVRTNWCSNLVSTTRRRGLLKLQIASFSSATGDPFDQRWSQQDGYCSWGLADFSYVTRLCTRPVFQDSGLTGQASQLLDWGPGFLMCSPSSRVLLAHRTPRVRQDAPASCMRYHTPADPLNLNHGMYLCVCTHTLTHSRSEQARTNRNGVPAGASAHDMQCRLPCHVLQHYATREPSIAPDCTGSNAKQHARWT